MIRFLKSHQNWTKQPNRRKEAQEKTQESETLLVHTLRSLIKTLN